MIEMILLHYDRYGMDDGSTLNALILLTLLAGGAFVSFLLIIKEIYNWIDQNIK